MIEIIENQNGLTLRFRETQDQFFHYMLVVVFLIGAGAFLYFVGWPRYASASPIAGLTSLALAAVMFLYALVANPIRFITSQFDHASRTVTILRERRFGRHSLAIDYSDIARISCVIKKSKGATISFINLKRGDGRMFRLARVFGDPHDVQDAVARLSRILDGRTPAR